MRKALNFPSQRLSETEQRYGVDLSGVEFVRRESHARALFRTALRAIVAYGRSHWPVSPTAAAAAAGTKPTASHVKKKTHSFSLAAAAAAGEDPTTNTDSEEDDIALAAVMAALKRGLAPTAMIGGLRNDSIGCSYFVCQRIWSVTCCCCLWC